MTYDTEATILLIILLALVAGLFGIGIYNRRH